MKLVQSARVQRAVLGLLTLVVAAAPAWPANAAPQVQSYDLTINSQVIGPPPTTPPTIDSPADNTTFDEKQIEVTGTCVSALIVKIYRNNVFAGSALCGTDGTYSLHIDLVEGRNDLVARQYDTANQASPDSNTVTVYYVPKTTPPVPHDNQNQSTIPGVDFPQSSEPGGTQSGGSGTSATAPFQLLIDYEYTLQAIFPNQSFQLPIKFTGGTPPYAVSVDWGDGAGDVFVRDSASHFDVSHKYTEPGFHTVKLKVSDAFGQKAAIQFVLIVNGSAKEAFANQLFVSPDYAWLRVAGGTLLILTWIAVFIAGQEFQIHKLRHAKKPKK